MPLLDPSQVIISLDIGTCSGRGPLIDSKLNIFSTYQINNTFFQRYSGWVEQNSDEEYQMALEIIQQPAFEAHKTESKIIGICFTSAASSLPAKNEKFDPLCNSITWADSRPHSQADELHKKASALFKQTGVPLNASYGLLKFIWLQIHQLNLVSKAVDWMGLKVDLLFEGLACSCCRC
jgi:sugar (pentulose or hexulose) kinase